MKYIFLIVFFCIYSSLAAASSTPKEDNEYAEYYEKLEGLNRSKERSTNSNRAPHVQISLSRTFLTVRNRTDSSLTDIGSGPEFHFSVIPYRYVRAQLGFSSLSTGGIVSNIQSTNINLLMGTNFQTSGFTSFYGFGYHIDTWDGIPERFKAAQVSFGTGYNWSKVGLDVMYSWRDAKPYADFYRKNTSTEYKIKSSLLSFSISLRI